MGRTRSEINSFDWALIPDQDEDSLLQVESKFLALMAEEVPDENHHIHQSELLSGD